MRFPLPSWLSRFPPWARALGLAILLGLVGWWAGTRAPRIQPPPPAVTQDEDWVPPLPPSRLTVPIVADLTTVLSSLERAVPQRRGSLEDRQPVDDNDRLEIAFELMRSPFDAELHGNTAYLRAIIAYRGRAWYDPPILPTVSAACAADPDELAPRAVVELSSPLWLTRDWSLGSQPRVVRVAPLTDTDRDRCRLTVFEIDVTGKVMDGARALIEERLSDIRAAIAEVDVRSRFESWWATLSEPISLDDDVWLVLHPRGVAVGESSWSGLTLTAATTLTAEPTLVLGPRPAVAARPLPDLDTTSVAEGLTIRAVAEADYRTASERLDERLAGQTLEASGHTLRIDGLALSGIGGRRVALEVDIGGAANGRVYLVGTPAYDEVQHNVHVPDLEFDVATLNVLVGGLDWLAHDELVLFLRENARWPVADLTDLAEGYLARGLNTTLTEGVVLEGRVDSVSILGIHPTRQALFVHTAARAQATLRVDRD